MLGVREHPACNRPPARPRAARLGLPSVLPGLLHLGPPRAGRKASPRGSVVSTALLTLDLSTPAGQYSWTDVPSARPTTPAAAPHPRPPSLTYRVCDGRDADAASRRRRAGADPPARRRRAGADPTRKRPRSPLGKRTAPQPAGWRWTAWADTRTRWALVQQWAVAQPRWTGAVGTGVTRGRRSTSPDAVFCACTRPNRH